MTGRPSERCAAAEALERILQGAGSPWVRQQARAVLASPCCVSAADQEQVKEALGRERACRVWAYQQLRGWWRGNRRDMSDPAAAIAELDREEAVLDASLALLSSNEEEER